MAKEYFSHDYNARNDRKIAALVRDHKSSGYGIFWATCEMMHEENGKLELDDITLSAIAKDLNEDFDLVKNVIFCCIDKYKLFLKNEDVLNSKRVHSNLRKRLNISEIRSNAGKAGAIAKQKQAKESKVNERKESRVKGIFPKQDFVIDLTDHEKGKAIEYLSIVKKFTAVDDKLVNSIWETFKIKNLTGEKFYKDGKEIVSHFFESLKYQQHNGSQTHQSGNGNGIKLGTSDARIDKAKNW